MRGALFPRGVTPFRSLDLGDINLEIQNHELHWTIVLARLSEYVYDSLELMRQAIHLA